MHRASSFVPAQDAPYANGHVPHGRIHSRLTGSVIENVAPQSGLFAAHMLPP